MEDGFEGRRQGECLENYCVSTFEGCWEWRDRLYESETLKKSLGCIIDLGVNSIYLSLTLKLS